MSASWSATEILTLKTSFNEPWAVLCHMFPGRTNSGIRKKMKKLGLRRTRPCAHAFEGLAARIRESLYKRRAALDISGRRLSALLGYNESAVKDWESGTSAPTLRSLIDWADGLGMELVVMRRM